MRQRQRLFRHLLDPCVSGQDGHDRPLPAEILSWPSATVMRIASSEVAGSAAAAAMRLRIACARRSAGNDDTPRTRNSSTPSSSTGAVGVVLLDQRGCVFRLRRLRVYGRRGARPEARPEAGNEYQGRALETSRPSHDAARSMRDQSCRAKQITHALDELRRRRLDVVERVVEPELAPT